MVSPLQIQYPHPARSIEFTQDSHRVARVAACDVVFYQLFVGFEHAAYEDVLEFAADGVAVDRIHKSLRVDHRELGQFVEKVLIFGAG